MIDGRALIMLLMAVALAGAGYWWLEGGTMPRFGFSDPGVERGSAAESKNGAESAAATAATYEKAIIACLLAASYAAERGARIDEVSTLLAAMPADQNRWSAEDIGHVDALTRALPDHERERDAAYRLYFTGLAALAGASETATDAAFTAVQIELDKAGLGRLTRTIATVQAQVARARKGEQIDANRDVWIKELKNAVQS